MNAQGISWDDLRLFLAVARTGSLSGAARQLRVHHSTVFRRIGALEAALGVRLFERLPDGYALTPAGEEMLPSAELVEDEIAAIGRKVTGTDLRLSGKIRITTVDILTLGVLPGYLSAFRRAYPGILLDVVVSNTSLDLTRREADIALRASNRPSETLVGRRVARLAFGVYAARGYGGACPGTDLAQQDWIGFDDEHAPLARWFAAHVKGAQPVYRTNSIAAALGAAKAGLGLAPLPCGLADREPDLVRLQPLPEDFTLDLWLLTHQDLRRTARIRAFLDFISEALAADAPLFEGRRPQPGPASASDDSRAAAPRTPAAREDGRSEG